MHEITPAGGSISADGLEPQYSGGITLDHEDPSHVYLSRQVGAAWQVEAWTTYDGGAHWVSEAITAGSTEMNVRPVSPRGQVPFDSGLRVIWMHGTYVSYSTYGTSLSALWVKPKPARLRFSHAAVHVNRRGRAWVPVRCLAGREERCRVSGTVRRGQVRLGKLAGSLRGMKRGNVALRLSRRELRRVRHAHRLEVRLVLISRNWAGVATTARWTEQLRFGS